MTEQEQEKPWGFAKCHFGSAPTLDRLYDYIAPFPVAVGDVVKVERNGGAGWAKVTVAEIVAESETAKAKILEIIPPEPKEDDDDE